MKRCSKCCLSKPTSEFNKRGAGRLQSHCRECQHAYYRKHYRENCAGYKRRTRQTKARIRAYVREQKTGKTCMDCEQAYPHFVLQFDHVKGAKEFCLSRGCRTGSINAVKADLEKCEIVCANCHAMRTFARSHKGVL